MTQEDKSLLLKDLCARLPYGVKVKHEAQDFPSTLLWVDSERLSAGRKADKIGVGSDWGNIEFIKPYLRPMSSMTEEEFEKLKEYSELKYEQLDLASYQNGTYKCLDFYLSEVPSYVVILVFDWLNAHHFDFRNLIERGLAIEVNENNNPYKL